MQSAWTLALTAFTSVFGLSTALSGFSLPKARRSHPLES